MADNKIKISADTSEIRKSLLDLSKDVKELGKSKVAIFNKEERDYLKAGAKKALENIKKQMEANRKELQAALKEQTKTNKTVMDEYKNRKKIHDIMKRQVDLQKQMHKAQEISGIATGGIGGFINRAKGGMGRAASALGLGGAMRFLGPLGMAAGAGAFLYGRGRNAYNTYKGGVNERLMLRGRQVGDMGLENPERAYRAGLNAQSMRRARLQSMDIFGRAGSTQQAVMQRAEFERNFGIQQGTMAGIGGQLRGTLGGKGAEKAVMAVQASLIASGITDEIGPYLETAAQMLTDINEKGISFSDSAMALLSTVAGGGEIAPERAGRIISGIDQAIRGSTGEANAFFQKVFQGAGIGGGTLGGIQAAIRSGGLFGANVEQGYMSDVDKRAFKEMGIGGRTMGGVARSMVKNLDTLFGSESEVDKLLRDPNTKKAGAAKRLQRNQFIMQTFGLQNEVQAAEVNRLMTEAANPKTSVQRQVEIEKKIKNIQAGNTELGNLQKINESTAAMVNILESKTISVQDKMGEKLAPLFTRLDSVMMHIDSSLVAIMDFFGIKTPEEEMKPGLQGKTEINQSTFDIATMGSAEKQKEFSKQLGDTYKTNKKELENLQKEADKVAGGEGKGRYYHLGGEKGMKMQMLEKQQQNIEKSFMKVKGLDAKTGLGKEGVIQMTDKVLERAKKDQESMNMFNNIGDTFSGFFDDMKSFFSGDSKESSNNNDGVVKGIEEMVKHQKQNVKATERSTRAIKDGTGAPATTGRT